MLKTIRVLQRYDVRMMIDSTLNYGILPNIKGGKNGKYTVYPGHIHYRQ